MAEIKSLVPCLHEHKIHLEVVYIRIEENLADAPSRQRSQSRHVVLASVHATRAIVLGRDDLGLTGVYGPV